MNVKFFFYNILINSKINFWLITNHLMEFISIEFCNKNMCLLFVLRTSYDHSAECISTVGDTFVESTEIIALFDIIF